MDAVRPSKIGPEMQSTRFNNRDDSIYYHWIPPYHRDWKYYTCICVEKRCLHIARESLNIPRK